ncbi:MAG: hypothetical protein HY063_04715 [Bacteroidetes bacterium]|nr:hypothetical protein [Bacteroidota bacterium]
MLLDACYFTHRTFLVCVLFLQHRVEFHHVIFGFIKRVTENNLCAKTEKATALQKISEEEKRKFTGREFVLRIKLKQC